MGVFDRKFKTRLMTIDNPIKITKYRLMTQSKTMKEYSRKIAAVMSNARERFKVLHAKVKQMKLPPHRWAFSPKTQNERGERRLAMVVEMDNEEEMYVMNSAIKMNNTRVVIGGAEIFPNYPYTQLLKLMRCRNPYSKKPISTFSHPLSFHVLWMTKFGNMLSADLKSAVTILESLQWNDGTVHYIDDFYRQTLAEVDKITFWYVHNAPTHIKPYFAGMLGLSSMGGPRSWTIDDITNKVSEWVTGDFKWSDEIEEYCAKRMDSWFDTWKPKMAKDFMTYEEYTTDLSRWATPGGAPSVRTNLTNKEETLRSKWAWGLHHLEVGNIHKALDQSDERAGAAIKEEEKTRVIITTPMSSYVRQCYILYRMGDPKFLKSTISDSERVTKLAGSMAKTYICLDASKFDHNVPKMFVMDIFHRLRAAAHSVSDLQLVEVITREIESIENLVVTYDGKSFPYQKGILSGWRFTSFIGSMLSALVCEYIMSELNIMGDYCVQGDDIIIWTNDPISQDAVFKTAEKFGMEVNKKKTTISTSGEFLKYVYGEDKIYGYPARCVRSIFYANPWLDTTAVSQPSEVASKWHTYYSRMSLTTGNVLEDTRSYYYEASKDINGWLGGRFKTSEILELFHSPMSLGGLGTYEFMSLGNMSMKVLTSTPVHTKTDKSIDLNVRGRVYNVFGIRSERGPLSVKEVKITPATYLNLIDAKKRVRSSIYTKDLSLPDKFPDDVNILRSYLESVSRSPSCPAMIRTIVEKQKGRTIDADQTIPRPFRYTHSWKDKLKNFLEKEGVALPSSLYLDNRYSVSLNRYAKKMTDLYINSIDTYKYSDKITLTMYLIDMFSNSATLVHSM